jgi:hypothetical protein
MPGAMQASQPIRPPKSPTDGHLTAIGLLVTLGIVVAIIKPWGSSLGAAAVPLPATPAPSPTASAQPSPDLGFGGRDYDPSIFGEHEPEAVWGVWPAGFLTTFGFVIQVPATPAPLPSPGAGKGVQATPATLSAPSGSAFLPGSDLGPSWPARLEMPDGDHLLLIGLDMPRGYSMTLARLDRAAADGSRTGVDLVRLKSPWPSHFAVVGMATPVGDGRLDVWPPGTYELSLSFEPGGIERTIEIRIGGPVVGP